MADKDRERFPTEAEMRSMIWQNIAGGANGIVSFNLRGETWAYLDSLLKVHREVAAMAPILLSVEPVPELTVSDKDVACRVWVRNGRYYLVACNLTDRPLRAKVRIGAPFDCEEELSFEPIGVVFRRSRAESVTFVPDAMEIVVAADASKTVGLEQGYHVDGEVHDLACRLSMTCR